MPQFELEGAESPAFVSLPNMVQGFIEAMFFTECCVGNEYAIANWHDPETQDDVAEGRADGCLPSDSGFAELQPDSVAAIVRFCAAFEERAKPLLESAYERDYDATQAGRDLWFTYNGHGTGFWSRDALAGDTAEYEALTAEMIAANQRDDMAAWDAACAKRSAIKTLGDKLSDACGRGEINPWFGDDGRIDVTGV